MVICLERGADLHMVHLMPLPLIVSCFSKIHIGFTFLVLACPGSPGKTAVKCVCVCVFLHTFVPYIITEILFIVMLDASVVLCLQNMSTESVLA